MAITFRSSRQAERVLIEREGNGTQRVAKATQSEHNDHVWKLRLEHPAGSSWDDTFTGNGTEVMVRLAQMMCDHELDYMHERNRNHRPPPVTRDLNTSINDMGMDVSAPITKRW
jgi:predicted alpha/beta-hydrolase family hydrolase